MRILLIFIFISGLLFSCENDVAFLDKALEACIRNTTGQTGDLTQEDFDKITILYCGQDEPGHEENGINSIKNIEKLRNLSRLILYKSHVTDISPLRELKKLTFLGITSDLPITSYEPILRLPLTFLGLHDVELEDISFLSQIKTLEELNLQRNRIQDISVIGSLPKLKLLDIRYNRITSLYAIAQHPNIENFTDLSIGYNCLDCAVEDNGNIVSIQEKNPNLYVICNPGNQLLPENCSE